MKILADIMGTVRETCILVKYSPKREKMPADMKENIDTEFDDYVLADNSSMPSMDKLCVTRWTVRGMCFENIILNYLALMKFSEACLSESRATEVKARIIGCQKQMKNFFFFFGLCLGKRLFMITENLSARLQNKDMSAVSSNRCAELIIQHTFAHNARHEKCR